MVLSRKKRMDEETTLSLTGRDVEAEEYSIMFDKEAKCWRMKGNREDVEKIEASKRYADDPIVKTIKALLNNENQSWNGTSRQLADEIEVRENIEYDCAVLGRALRPLAAELGSRDDIQHQTDRTKSGRTHRFYRSVL
ncbi:MAG: hypothetical protein GX781_00345, partial [Clostridiales bacterium]|nr:hypothetical protein [Clostridiales bacterium]